MLVVISTKAPGCRATVKLIPELVPAPVLTVSWLGLGSKLAACGTLALSEVAEQEEGVVAAPPMVTVSFAQWVSKLEPEIVTLPPRVCIVGETEVTCGALPTFRVKFADAVWLLAAVPLTLAVEGPGEAEEVALTVVVPLPLPPERLTLKLGGTALTWLGKPPTVTATGPVMHALAVTFTESVACPPTGTFSGLGLGLTPKGELTLKFTVVDVKS